MTNKLPVGSSVSFELVLTNPIISPPEVTDASVEVVVTDETGAQVSGVTWPILLPHVTEEPGTYRKTVDPISGLQNGAIYHVEYTATGANGVVGVFCVDLKAKGC